MIQDSLRKLLEDSTVANAITVQIINIQRYIRDKKAELMLPMEMPNTIKSIYDLTLSDGINKLKCVLHPSLNKQVEHGDIIINSLVIIKQYKKWYDETKPGSGKDPILVIFELASLSEIEFELNSSPGSMKTLNKTNIQKPLIGDRGYYISLYNDDCFDMHDSNIFCNKLPIIEKSNYQEIQEDIITFNEIRENFFTTPSQIYTEPIIGRVIQKTSLNHYAKIEDNHNPFPLNFQIQIVNENEILTVTIWNRLACYYFNCINIGMLILIQNFKVQKK